MGVNILVKKIISKQLQETWGGKVFTHYMTENQDWFDSLRYRGDFQFVFENEWEFVDVENPIEEQELVRPKNFAKCRDWVNNSILLEGNKNRLINVLDVMEKDESLAFKMSW